MTVQYPWFSGKMENFLIIKNLALQSEKSSIKMNSSRPNGMHPLLNKTKSLYLEKDDQLNQDPEKMNQVNLEF